MLHWPAPNLNRWKYNSYLLCAAFRARGAGWSSGEVVANPLRGSLRGRADNIQNTTIAASHVHRVHARRRHRLERFAALSVLENEADVLACPLDLTIARPPQRCRGARGRKTAQAEFLPTAAA